jgi:hypothetical protein
MEMKSEYNYGTKKSYDVTLYGDKCGHNKKQLVALYNEYSKTKFTRDEWQHIGKHEVIMRWQGLSEAQLEVLTRKLADIGALPEICIRLNCIAFHNEVLQQDPIRNRVHPRVPTHLHEQIRQDSARFRNYWYSGALTVAHEYSLEIWAKNNEVDEAYRFTTIPALHNVATTRIWRKSDDFQMVSKIGGTTYFCDYHVHKTDNKPLERKDWNPIQSFMDENFWAASSWHSGRLITDGTIYLFEGWKNSQYKVLDDDTPVDETLTSLRAMRLFWSLWG